ncbi:MAG: MBL fold metallo-hydrolase [Candidatus Pacebacteria bacterium]|jgi:competence protein ComEC|nr:MBL fold metallo-hydrolase [Candidatus Paceibacterota bacterium]
MEISKGNKAARWMVFALLLANLFVWLALAGTSQNELMVDFFDVGQGDAAFVRLPQGTQMLIDGGPGQAVLEKLGKAMPFYDREIDWVILSHPDRDHVNGLFAVLKNYRIKNIVWSGMPGEAAEGKEWINDVAKEGANVILAAPGEKFDLGSDPSCFFEVLAPAAAIPSGSGNNDLSVVVRLAYGARKFLFTGDIAAKEGQALENIYPGLAADVLKVAHHGSKYGTDGAFLSALAPAAAVISVGQGNSYGHPSPEVLEILSGYGIKTLRTDQNGDILFRTDGERLFVRTQQ